MSLHSNNVQISYYLIILCILYNFPQVELVINQNVWVVMLVIKTAIICRDVAVYIYIYKK